MLLTALVFVVLQRCASIFQEQHAAAEYRAHEEQSQCPTFLPHREVPSSLQSLPWRDQIEPSGKSTAQRLFLSLLKTVLTGGVNEDFAEPFRNANTGQRENLGCDIQSDASCSMTWDGWARLTALEPVVEGLLRDKVAGDFAEVGVLKGAVTMFLQGMLLVHRSAFARNVWVVDSFEGMGSREQLEADAQAVGHPIRSKLTGMVTGEIKRWTNELRVSKGDATAVQDRFLRHGLLRPNVKILPGRVNRLFTHSCAPIRQLAFLRIDVDVYAATFHTLVQLYPKLAPGGVVLFDDDKLFYARKAMMDFRATHNVSEPLQNLSGTLDKMVYWTKSKGSIE